MRDKEINLVDLLVEILLHWRVIILLMLFAGIAMGAFSYIKSYRLSEIQKVQIAQQENGAAEDEKTEQEELTSTHISNVNTVLSYEKMYKESLDYQENSILMQIDANNIPRAELTFLVSSDDLKRTYRIEKVYEDLLASGGLYEYISEEMNIKSSAVSELITLEISSYSLWEGSDIIRVSIIHKDDDSCKKLAQLIIDYLDEEYDRLTNELGDYKLQVLNQSFAKTSNSNLLRQQRENKTSTLSLKTAARDLKAAFTDVEKEYYSQLKGEEYIKAKEEDEEEVLGEEVYLPEVLTIIEPEVNERYVVLGILAVEFIYVFFLFLQYIFNNKVRATENLQDLYKIAHLGQIPQSDRKKRFLGVVDQWILLLRDRNKRKFTFEESLNLAAIGVKMALKREKLETVYFVGCDLEKETSDICNRLKKLLAEQNINAIILSNVLYNADAMIQLEKVQGAILVEKAGETLYAEVVRELELLSQHSIMTLGGILVE